MNVISFSIWRFTSPQPHNPFPLSNTNNSTSQLHIIHVDNVPPHIQTMCFENDNLLTICISVLNALTITICYFMAEYIDRLSLKVIYTFYLDTLFQVCFIRKLQSHLKCVSLSIRYFVSVYQSDILLLKLFILFTSDTLFQIYII